MLSQKALIIFILEDQTLKILCGMEVFGGHHHEISMISCGMEVFGGHNHEISMIRWIELSMITMRFLLC